MALPASNSTTSPGTSSLADSSRSSPFRRTRTSGTASRFRAAIACSARYSWKKPSRANKITMAAIAAVSVTLPKKPETTAAAIKISTIVLVNWATSSRTGETPPLSVSSLGPNWACLAAASASPSPVSRFKFRVCTSSSVVTVCHGFCAIAFLRDKLSLRCTACKLRAG